MDRVGADFYNVLKMMKERLGAKPLVIQLPWGSEENFKGVIDLVRMRGYIWDEASLGAQMDEIDIPEEMVEAADIARENLLETVAESDDEIMEKYLGEEEITQKELMAAIRKATTELKLVPILCGAALRNRVCSPLSKPLSTICPLPSKFRRLSGRIRKPKNPSPCRSK